MNLQDMGIPAVDLAGFIHGNEDEKMAFVAELGKAYEDIGFVAVKNHLIQSDTVSTLYSEVQKFFDLLA